MSPESAPSLFGYRHLYTASNVGARGVAGFQTVACAKELEVHRRALEVLVESYLPATEDSPFRCFQLAELTAAEGYAVISRLEPWGNMPDGRAGNLWVENLVVPSAWLEAAAWDVDQVLEQLEEIWQSPEILAEIVGWPHSLEPVALPEVAPGSLDRLAFFPQTLSAGILPVFVQAVVRQFRSRSPVAVVAPPTMSVEDLERLVRRAPLLLPPGRRGRNAATALGVLRLRTRARVDSAPEVELLGVPSSWYEHSSTFPGRVVELASPRSTAPADDYGVAYVHWLLERIGEEDWPTLEAYFAAPAVGEDPIETFSPPSPRSFAAPPETPAESLPPAPPRVVWTPGTPIPDTEDDFLEQALARREMAWEFRRKAEETMNALRRQFQADLDQLTTALKDSMDKKMRQQEQDLAELERQMLNKSGKIQKRLEQMLATLREENRQVRERITDEQERLSSGLLQSEKNHRKKLVDTANAQQQEANKLFKAWQDSLRDVGERSRREFAQDAQRWEDHLSRVQAGMGGESPMVEPGEQVDPVAKPQPPTGRSAHVPGLFGSIQPWFGVPQNRKNLLWGSLVGTAMLFIAFVAVPYVMDLKEGQPLSSPLPPLEPSIEERYEEVLARLRQQPLTTAVLAKVRARQDLRVHGRTLELSEIQLADLGPWVDAEGCTLLQAVLDITIDGDCGDISKSNARTEANKIRQAEGKEALAGEGKDLGQDVPLVFRKKFGLSEECNMAWPLAFSADCKPSPEGAGNLLATAQKVLAARQSNTAAAVRTIIEGEWTAQSELPGDFGTRLFPIAHRLCTQPDPSAEAGQSLPSIHDLSNDKEAFEGSLETMETCFDALMLEHEREAE